MPNTPIAKLLLSDWAPRAISLDSCRSLYGELSQRFANTIDVATAHGRGTDRLGYAFYGAYEAALHQMFPSLPPHQSASLCVTEEGGNHPKAIQTRLVASPDGLVLTGQKKWITLANEAHVLFVAAQTTHGLSLVRLDANEAGVEFVAMGQTPFVPEIPHFFVTFNETPLNADAVLAGDGWQHYIKPFRTIEDTHVLAAVLGYLLGEGTRQRWPHQLLAEALNLVFALRELARMEPLGSETHIRLEGCFQSVQRLVADLPWEDTAAKERFERDRPLLDIAGWARKKRFAKALETLGIES